MSASGAPRLAGLLALLTIASLVLSGCSGKAASDATTAEGGLVATDTTGIIRGVVVDEGIRPLAGVLLTATGQGTTATTNSSATGSFGFQGLAPGTYFVKAHHAGYRDNQASTEVHAGLADPQPVKLLLGIDSTYVKPYAAASVFKGFIDCGVTTPAIAVAVCSIPNGPTCGMDPVPCTGNVTADNFITFIPVDGGVPRWIQHELVWQATQAGGDQFNLAARSAKPGGGFDDLPGDFIGPSPLLATINATVIHDHDIGRNGTGLLPSVFTGGIKGTGDQVCAPVLPSPLPHGGFCLFDTGATLEQDFTLYTHIFYGFSPPDGYRFTRDGDPVPPGQ